MLMQWKFSDCIMFMTIILMIIEHKNQNNNITYLFSNLMRVISLTNEL